MYEGVWANSIGTISDAIRADNALLITSTLPEDKAKALRELVEPAVEDLGGQEVVEDFEVEVEAEPDDLTVLTGIGPKYAAALSAAGHDDVRGTRRRERAEDPCAHSPPPI